MTSSSPSSSPPTSSSPGDASGDSWGEPGHELDLCGELCPFTFVRTKLALEELAMGARLRVIVDHEPAIRNIPRSAAEWGQEVVAVLPAGAAPGTWAIDLRKRVR